MKNLIYYLLLLTIISCGKENPVVSDPVVSYTLTVNSGNGGNVSSTGGSYNEGQSVSITATPDSEYVFVNWSNGSTDNPLSITVNSNQTITANFEKRKYPLTINIQGEGTVREEIVSSGKSTPTEYNSGTVVRLTAIPNECWEFDQWLGESENQVNPIELNINSSETLEVLFNEIELIEIPDHNDLSYRTRFYYPKNFIRSIRNLNPNETWNILEGVVLDYNQDGFLDFVYTNSDYTSSFNNIEVRNKILFFKGDCNNELIIDDHLSNRFDGLIHGYKGLVGDYNNDGYPDIFFVGSGTDVAPDFPGEYPILLTNISGFDFEEERFENLVGYFHTACSGDYDNDNDLDIVLISQGKTYLMKNNSGRFDIFQDDINLDYGRTTYNYPEATIVPQLNQIYTSELFDVDGDGFLDLIVSGADYPQDQGYPTKSLILYGNGTSFTEREKVLPTIDGFGICLDIDFFDINNDGQTEIILNRVSDYSYFAGPYWGTKIQVLELVNNEYVDSTNKFIDVSEFSDEGVIEWIQIYDYDNDGIIEMFDDSFSTGFIGSTLNYEWDLIGNRFILKTD